MIISLLMWVVFSITVAYLIVIGIITYGWFRLLKNHYQTKADEVNVSVVIAVRNESSNIQSLLKQIINQDYPTDYFEIIVVNDHSTDNTLQLIHEFKTDNPTAKITVVEATENGKKKCP